MDGPTINASVTDSGSNFVEHKQRLEKREADKKMEDDGRATFTDLPSNDDARHDVFATLWL